MRKTVVAVLAALMGCSVMASPGSASVAGLCGSRSKLSATTPYSDNSVLVQLIATSASLKCGPYSGPRQWKVSVVLQQYYGGGWHKVASKTSGWKTAKSGTASTSASVACLGLMAYKFRAQATGYWRSSSKSSTKSLGSTFSSTVTQYC